MRQLWDTDSRGKVIVPFASGSGSDATARYFAEKMAPLLGKPIIVENRPGADGAIGIKAVKSAPADGYTIVQGSISPMVVNVVINPDLGYDAVNDFVPLTGYSRNMNAVVVSNESPFRDFKTLIVAAKSAPAPLNIGTFSTTLAMSGAYLGSLAGVKFNNIPYKGQSAVVNDIMGNQLDFAVVDLGGAFPLIRAGKLRALAVTGDNRSPSVPEIPTVKELGYNYIHYSWNAFYVRSGTPESIRIKLGEAVRKVMTDEDTIRNFYSPKGTEGVPLTPQEMQKLQLDEIARFKRIAAEAGIVAKP